MDVQRLLQGFGLQVCKKSWEDNARFKGSVWGPAIHDVSLNIHQKNGSTEEAKFLRYSNRDDPTIEGFSLKDIPLLVGNEKTEPETNLYVVTLEEYLSNFRAFQTNPEKINLRYESFLLPEEKPIASAQTCILPVSKDEPTKFSINVRSYNTSPFQPDTLVIISHPKYGTTAQILLVNSEAGQTLYFNNGGQRSLFQVQPLNPSGSTPREDSEWDDSNLLVIFVPIKSDYMYDSNLRSTLHEPRNQKAFLELSKPEGPFRGFDASILERNPSHPIRIVFQRYIQANQGQLFPQDVIDTVNFFQNVQTKHGKIFPPSYFERTWTEYRPHCLHPCFEETFKINVKLFRKTDNQEIHPSEDWNFYKTDKGEYLIAFENPNQHDVWVDLCYFSSEGPVFIDEYNLGPNELKHQPIDFLDLCDERFMVAVSQFQNLKERDKNSLYSNNFPITIRITE